MGVVAEATRRRPDYESAIRRRDRRRIIREWAFHRQGGIFDTDKDKMNIKNPLLLSLRVFTALTLALIAVSADQAFAQTMTFEEYEPKSTMVVPEHHIPSAK